MPSPNFTDQVAALIGIGVGIDYTLLVVTRYRAALGRHGAIPRTRSAEALSTAGRSVILAGSTVVVSLMGLFLMNLSTFDGLAVGTALAVLIVVAATLTLLPALLGFAAGRMFKRSTEAGRTRPHPAPDPVRGGQPPVQPGRAEAGGAGLAWAWLACSSWPPRPCTFTSARLTPAPTLRAARPARPTTWPFGASARARWGPSRSSLKRRRRRNPSAPLPAAPAVRALVSAFEATPGVIAVAAPQFSPSGTAAVLQVTPAWGPADRHTAALIGRLRHDTLPAVEHQTGITAHVGGETAGNVDFASLTAKRLPLLLLGVLTISFLLLLVGFRSVAVAAQAIVLNLLSVGAAYGIVVAVFQWGWGAGLTGAPAAPVAPWIPTMLFAITFGLSMDYEVFVIGAIRDARARHRERQAGGRRAVSPPRPGSSRPRP